jgi:peptidoglycan/xylan/chitin deacetylase (PgdA/CDA1 family)
MNRIQVIVRTSITLLALCLMLLSVMISRAEDEPVVVRGDGTLRRARVPILMYHYVSLPPPGSDGYRINLSISPDMFREHVDYLANSGYITVSLYDLDDALEFGKRLPDKPVILTFDDGYSDHYETVFPLLKERGMTGTFFVITQPVDQNQPGYLTWEQVTEMAAQGMDMESHSKTHPNLSNRDYDFLVYQILGSMESLTAHTGEAVRLFCYPGGNYDDNTLGVVSSANVLRAVTTEHGVVQTTDNRYELPRLRITNRTGVPGLVSLLKTRI